MEEEIIKIAKDFEQGTITEAKAQSLLLGLFGVRQRFKDKQEYKWMRFADQYPIEQRKIVARYLNTPEIIGEAHHFNPESDNARRANLYACEWRYVE